MLHTTNDETGDRTIATSGSFELIAGRDKIVEELLGLNFEISMKSFFQTNPKSAEKLYSKVIEYALEKREAVDHSVVLDLFCGTGTIGQLLASKGNGVRVVGVDIVPSAIEDARENARRNGIEGLEFYAADVGKFLGQCPQYTNAIKTIILILLAQGLRLKLCVKLLT